MNTFTQQAVPVPPQVELPSRFPTIPNDVRERFGESARDWQRRLDEFWTSVTHGIQQAQEQTARQVNGTVVFSVDSFRIYAGRRATPMFDLNANQVRLGGVLVVDTPSRKVFIGAGGYADARTPFFIDADGFFSLGDSLTWDPETDTLMIAGTLDVDAGEIGGFTINSNSLQGPNLALFANDYSSAVRVTRSANYQTTMSADGLTIVDGFGANAFTLATDNVGNVTMRFFDNNSEIIIGDVNLYRSAANTLATDDSFVIGGTATISSLAGVGTRAVLADASGVLSAP